MERQGLWCRLYVSNNQCPCTMRYKRYRTMSERRGGKQCDWSIQFTRRSLSTERAIKCVHLIKNGRKQPECGQPGYAVVCYTSHLPYTTRYILPDYVRGGRDENSAARQGQFQTRWPKQIFDRLKALGPLPSGVYPSGATRLGLSVWGLARLELAGERDHTIRYHIWKR